MSRILNAVKLNRFEEVKQLVENGAEVTSEDKDARTSVLLWACEKGNSLIVDYLLQHGAVEDLDKHDVFGRSSLKVACIKGHTTVVRTLLRFNVDIRKEKELICGNDEISNILKLELKKSIKHRQKIQILKAMDDENLAKVKQPLKYFSTDASLLLGTGSMGTSVYVGVLEDGSEVAVKRMLIQSCQVAAQNEKEILSAIESPYVSTYRHFLRGNTFLYLIVDLCEETLKELVNSQSIEYLKKHGPRMIKEILTGLKFLHDQGILHRDLKPSNVLVDIDGHMRLADFGISRVLKEDETTVQTDPKGTQGWMAAEVIEAINNGEKCRFKKKSDIQVTGMIAYFILTKGEHPFGPALDRMRNIIEGNSVPLKKLGDRDARKFVSWLISHKIRDRPCALEALSHSLVDQIDTEEGLPQSNKPKITLMRADRVVSNRK